MEPDELVSVKEAARRVDRSEDTIRRWLDEGKLRKVVRAPREVLVNARELSDFRRPCVKNE